MLIEWSTPIVGGVRAPGSFSSTSGRPAREMWKPSEQESGDGTRLALEAHQGVGIVREPFRQRLDRRLTLQPRARPPRTLPMPARPSGARISYELSCEPLGRCTAHATHTFLVSQTGALSRPASSSNASVSPCSPGPSRTPGSATSGKFLALKSSAERRRRSAPQRRNIARPWRETTRPPRRRSGSPSRKSDR